MQRLPSHLVSLLPLVAAALLGCSRDPETATAPNAAGAYTTPRTPWGDPDLRGMWPIDKLNGTPVQRPQELGDRRYLTDEEYAARVERLRGLNARYDDEIANNKMGSGHWAEMGAMEGEGMRFRARCGSRHRSLAPGARTRNNRRCLNV